MDVVWLHLMAFLGANGLVILFNFNVVARPGDNMGSRVPEADGLYLWKSMHEASVGRLGVVVDGVVDHKLLEAWMKINGMKAVLYEVLETDDPLLKAEKIQLILSAAGGSKMYFDTDPRTVEKTVSMGIPSLLVCNPYVVRSEWSTHKKMKGWEDLVTEIDKQVLMRSEKQWEE